MKRYKRRLKRVSKIRMQSFETYEEFKLRVLNEVGEVIDKVARSQNLAKAKLDMVIGVHILELDEEKDG